LLESESLAAPGAAPEAEESSEEEVDAIVVEDPDTTESEATEGESDSPEDGETTKSAMPAVAPIAAEAVAAPGAEEQSPAMLEPELPDASEPEPPAAPETTTPATSTSILLDETVIPAPQPREKRRKRERTEIAPEPDPIAGGGEGGVPLPVRVIGLDEVTQPMVDAPVAEEIAPALAAVREFTSEHGHSSQPTIVDLEDVSAALPEVTAVPVIGTGQSEPLPASAAPEKSDEIETPFFVLAPSANGAPWTDEPSKVENSVMGLFRRAVRWMKSTWQKLTGK
jgi:hypothetical protein